MEEATKRGLIQQLTMLRNTSNQTPNPGAISQTFYPQAQLPSTQFCSPASSAPDHGQAPPSRQAQPAVPAIVAPSTQNSTIYHSNSSSTRNSMTHSSTSANTQKTTTYSPSSSITRNSATYSPSSFNAQNAMIYTPSLSNMQSTPELLAHANASHHSTPPTSQFGRPTSQYPSQPPQDFLPFDRVPSPSVGNSRQYVHHSNTDPIQRHYPQAQSLHVQRSQSTKQARYNPYGSTPNRSSYSIPQTLRHGTSQPQPPSGTSTPPCMLSQRPEHSHEHNGMTGSSLSRSLDGGAQPRCDGSQVLLTNNTPPSKPLPRAPLQSPLPPGVSQPPLYESSQGLPSNNCINAQTASQGSARPHMRTTSQTPGPVDSMSPSSRENKPQPLISQNAQRSHLRELSQAAQPPTSQTLHCPPKQPQPQPQPPRVWTEWLVPITKLSPGLQAQLHDEGSLETQKALLEKVQKRSLTKLRPHEFLEYLSMDYNALFKPKVARVYDFYFMQALLFHNESVLLISRRQDCSHLEPPQSIRESYDMSGYAPHAQIELHIHTILNRVTDLLPDEILPCPGYDRHDSAISVVKANGDVGYGWSTTLCYEIKMSNPMPSLCNHSMEFVARPILQRQIKDTTNIDPVWKSKILEIFEKRKNITKALQNIGNTWS